MASRLTHDRMTIITSMIQLTAHQYTNVASLFEPLKHHQAVVAALASAIPATVYADDPIRPQTAFIQAKHRLFLAGEPDEPDTVQAVGRLFADTIRPAAKAAGLEMFLLWYAPDGWAEAEHATEIMPNMRPTAAQRQHYTLHAPRLDWRSQLPDGFELRQVDAALLQLTGLAHLDELRAEMCSERPSVEAFLAHSFGVCLVHDHELAGWCLSEYNTAGACEIGIETREPYRRRGLATLMTSAFVELASSRGVQRVGWDCWTNNQASVATALKAGFVKAHDDAVFYGWFDG